MTTSTSRPRQPPKRKRMLAQQLSEQPRRHEQHYHHVIKTTVVEMKIGCICTFLKDTDLFDTILVSPFREFLGPLLFAPVTARQSPGQWLTELLRLHAQGVKQNMYSSMPSAQSLMLNLDTFTTATSG